MTGAGAPSLRELAGAFAKIGALGFGGPAGQIALMQKMLVEERRWLDEGQYLLALNLCMLLPGPEAQQLATYCGWKLRGVAGGVIAGALFVLPGAVVLLALSAAFAAYGEAPVLAGALLGLKAVVLAVVLEALLRVARRALKTRLALALAAGAFAALFFFDLPFPLTVLTAGLAGWVLNRPAVLSPPPPFRLPWARTMRTGAVWLAVWLTPVAAAWAILGRGHVLTELGLFFSQVSLVTFGGAYAVLSYVAQEAVATYGWLTAAEMMKGLGLAETTPGPLVLVLQFVGFLAGFREGGGWTAALLGAAMTSWVTFAPSYLWIFLAAPHLEAIRARPRLQGALSGVTAAVVGVILNLSLWFGLHVLFARVEAIETGPLRIWVPEAASFQPVEAALALIAAAALLRFKVGLVWVLAGGAAAGAVLQSLA